jgi:hypothetical protein
MAQPVRDLDDIDLLVICAEAESVPRGANLLSWWLQGDHPRDIAHPSIQWWARRHAHELANWMNEEKPPRSLKEVR